MDTRTLSYFVAAAETENLSQAAERVHVVQSTLSHQMHRLEKEIGEQLFIRNGRRIRLSPKGALFLRDARVVLALVEEARERVRRAAAGEVGELRVGFDPHSSSSLMVAEAMAAYKESFPGVTVHLAPHVSADLAGLVLKGELDVAFLYSGEEEPDLGYRLLREFGWAVALPHGHALASKDEIFVADLVGECFLWGPRGNAPNIYDAMMAMCETGGLRPYILDEVYNELMVVAMVANGLGVSFVTDGFSQELHDHLVTVRRVQDFELTIPLGLVWRHDNDALALPRMVEMISSLTFGTSLAR